MYGPERVSVVALGDSSSVVRIPIAFIYDNWPDHQRWLGRKKALSRRARRDCAELAERTLSSQFLLCLCEISGRIQIAKHRQAESSCTDLLFANDPRKRLRKQRIHFVVSLFESRCREAGKLPPID